MKVLIDGDSLVYTVGFASQKNIWQAEDSEGIVYCENEAKQTVLTFIEDQAGELGALDVTRRIEVSPPEHAFHTIKVMVQKIATRAKANNYKIYLTGAGNFREGVATIMGYKHNRLDAEKPVLYQQIRDYMVQHHKATIVTGMEADDALSIVHQRSISGDPVNVSADPNHEVLRHPDECIIAAIDKDLRNIPGKHINFDKRVAENDEYKFIIITEEEGRRTFWKQVLTGDSSDNILGVPGMGPKKADKILDDVTSQTDEDYFWAVYGEYKRKFGTEPFNYRRYDAFEDTTATFRKRVAKPDDQLLPEQKLVGSALIFLVENARLLWMLREAPNAEGTHWWHPPISYDDIVLFDDNEKWLAKDAEQKKESGEIDQLKYESDYAGRIIDIPWTEGRGKWFAIVDQNGVKLLIGPLGTQKKVKAAIAEFKLRMTPAEDTQPGDEDTQSGEPMTVENQIPVSAEEAAAIDASAAEGIVQETSEHADVTVGETQTEEIANVNDRVYYNLMKDSMWGFYSEDFTGCYGPYDTEQEAREGLASQIATQNVGEDTQILGESEVVETGAVVAEPVDNSSEEVNTNIDAVSIQDDVSDAPVLPETETQTSIWDSSF